MRKSPVGRPGGERRPGPAVVEKGACIVMVCADREADQIAGQLSQLNRGCLITYRRVEDLVLNAPTGKVAMVVLAGEQPPAVTQRTLKWLRHRWPGCPVTVVGQAGGQRQEMTARQGGALYLTRPVRTEYWSEMVSHAMPPAAQRES